jgi:probable rRNA maturation factor
MVKIELYNKSKTHVCRKQMNLFLDYSAKLMNDKNDYLVSVAIVSPREIKKLNKIYRKKDAVTDVLSFESEDEFGLDEEGIGEIIICLDQAKKQARELKYSYKKEINRLVLHGYLHLLGFDHIKNKDAKTMEALEEKIMNKFYDQNKKAH